MSTPTAFESPVKIMGANPSLSQAEFARLAELVYDTCGIHLNDTKRQMVESRLQKRLRKTGIESFSAYWQLLSDAERGKEEIISLIDAISTNKTDFFRERAHFEYFKKQIVPTLGKQAKVEHRLLRIWSAGCSTGKEPYTLAMVLSDCKREKTLGEFSIIGTDISTEVLEAGRRAVYEEADLEAIPMAFRKEYLLKSKDRRTPTFRMDREMRSLVKFQRLNLIDQDFALEKPFDVIFCRNVMIYFDQVTKEKIVKKFHEFLRPGGYLFIGHSETLNGLSIELTVAAPTIYRKA